jgi:hypothetical protein
VQAAAELLLEHGLAHPPARALQIGQDFGAVRVQEERAVGDEADVGVGRRRGVGRRARRPLHGLRERLEALGVILKDVRGASWENGFQQLEKFKAAQLKKNEKYSKKRDKWFKLVVGRDLLEDGKNKPGRPK